MWFIKYAVAHLFAREKTHRVLIDGVMTLTRNSEKGPVRLIQQIWTVVANNTNKFGARSPFIRTKSDNLNVFLWIPRFTVLFEEHNPTI